MKRSIIAIGVSVTIISCMCFNKIINTTKHNPVEVAKVVVSDITGSILCSGKIESSMVNEIFSDSPLKINSVNVSIGDYVEKGQPLFTAQKIDLQENYKYKFNNYIEDQIQQGEVLSVFYNLLDNAQKTNKASIEVSDKNTDEFVALSPFKGLVADVSIKPEDLYSGYVSCIKIYDPNSLQVSATVSEDLIQDVAIGMKCNISGPGFDDTFSGTVSEISPFARTVQTLTGAGETVVDIVITLDSPSAKLMPGFSVKVDLINKEIPNALLVPYECITQDSEAREYVYVLYNNCIYRRYIETGYELDTLTEVTEGLFPNEIIIINPDEKLQNGQEVEVIDNEI